MNNLTVKQVCKLVINMRHCEKTHQVFEIRVRKHPSSWSLTYGSRQNFVKKFHKTNFQAFAPCCHERSVVHAGLQTRSYWSFWEVLWTTIKLVDHILSQYRWKQIRGLINIFNGKHDFLVKNMINYTCWYKLADSSRFVSIF